MNYESPNELGGIPSIIQEFSIEGLYGYRSISLRSEYAATILIAPNGSGKTTLLGALDAFIRGQFSRLTELNFREIRCRLRSHPEVLVLKSTYLNQLASFAKNKNIQNHATTFDVDPNALATFIYSEFDSNKAEQPELRENPVYEKIVARYGYDLAAVKQVCQSLQHALSQEVPELSYLRSVVRDNLSEYDIVYLPTYRRIELALAPEAPSPRYGKKRASILSRLGISKKGLFNADIQFGLADIMDRLAQLNQTILQDSNQGYREISANIINDMLSGTFENWVPDLAKIPDKDTLAVFFARLRDVRRMVGPYRNEYSIPDLDRIYNRESLPAESSKFLIYYLNKLHSVIGATRGIESTVEDFIQNCNSFLSEDPENSQGVHPDGKFMQLEKKTLRVQVRSIATSRRIPLEALSSGEKQMISLFARLYLYQRKKIVLIDEPELSLSIDWQKRILMEIVKAPQCAQVVAITHSPFVFDNNLEPFARPLELRIEERDWEHASLGDEGDIDG